MNGVSSGGGFVIAVPASTANVGPAVSRLSQNSVGPGAGHIKAEMGIQVR